MDTHDFLIWEATSRDTIDVKRIYIDVADDLVAGILLSQIVFWNLPAKDGTSKLSVHRDGRGWLAKKREDWWDECRITAKQYDRAIGILHRLGIIEIECFHFKGTPTAHIFLNLQVLLERVKCILTKGQLTSLPKVNLHIDQRSTYYRTETTAETTAETTDNSIPLPPLKCTEAPQSDILPTLLTIPQVSEIIDLYNKVTPESHKKVERLAARKVSKVKKYLKKFPTMAFWEKAFSAVGESLYLQGKSPTTSHQGFTADFDWFFKTGYKDGIENCQKAYEGKYRDQQRLAGGPESEDRRRANMELAIRFRQQQLGGQ